MKIFALNLCLTFAVSSKENLYQFQHLNFADLEKALAEPTAAFQRQLYISFDPSPAHVQQLFALQALETNRDRPYTIMLLCQDQTAYQEATRAFKAHFTSRIAAGGLVKNEKGEFLCIKHEGKWTLPKGHLEKGESTAEAAIREVKEETGLQELQLGTPLPTTYHTFFRKKKWSLKTTHWYRMKASSDQPIMPQTEEQIEEVAWKSQAEWMSIANQSYPSIRQLFEAEFASSLL